MQGKIMKKCSPWKSMVLGMCSFSIESVKHRVGQVPSRFSTESVQH